MKRKIATSINIRINVGNFQHVEISKYSEQEIDFSSTEQRIAMEDELHNEIVSDLIRNMRALPDRLGKTTSAVPVFEESVKKQVPDWMNSNIEPNIAKTSFNKKQAELKSEIIDEEKEIESLVGSDNKVEDSIEVNKSTSDEDLFSEIVDKSLKTLQFNEDKKETTVEEASVAVSKEIKENELLEFDDDDLFD